MIPSVLLALSLGSSAPGAPQETVKFTPTIKVYECPPGFQQRSDCSLQETRLEAQKLVLEKEVLGKRMGHWVFRSPPGQGGPATFYVIVVRGREGGHFEYSVSAECGLTGSPAPFANSRVEFRDDGPPASFGVSSAPMDWTGKKLIAEIRLADFHGKPVPARTP